MFFLNPLLVLKVHHLSLTSPCSKIIICLQYFQCAFFHHFTSDQLFLLIDNPASSFLEAHSQIHKWLWRTNEYVIVSGRSGKQSLQGWCSCNI